MYCMYVCMCMLRVCMYVCVCIVRMYILLYIHIDVCMYVCCLDIVV